MIKKFWQSFHVSIIFLLIGIIFSFFCVDDLPTGIIITLLMSIAATFIDYKIINEKKYEEQIEKLTNLQIEIDKLKKEIFNQKILENVKHPYFQKIIQNRLNDFIEANYDIFNGQYITNPHAEDTFGIKGLSYTKKGGNIKAVSVIDDYWKDDFAKKYLETQGELIKNNDVSIKRIFIFPKKSFIKKINILREQWKLGIKVYYLYSDSPYIDPTWYHDDFLIQDDELLVMIDVNSHKFDSCNIKSEIITMHPKKVQDKIVNDPMVCL